MSSSRRGAFKKTSEGGVVLSDGQSIEMSRKAVQDAMQVLFEVQSEDPVLMMKIFDHANRGLPLKITGEDKGYLSEKGLLAHGDREIEPDMLRLIKLTARQDGDSVMFNSPFGKPSLRQAAKAPTP